MGRMKRLPVRSHLRRGPWSTWGKMIVHVLGPCLLVIAGMNVGCSRTHRTSIPVGNGATLVMKHTFTPGLLDPSVTSGYTIMWRSGRRESLPQYAPFYDAKTARLEISNTGVWLIGEWGFAMRQGTPNTFFGRWFTWNVVPPSDELFDYMDHAANRIGNVGVRRKSYTIPKRLGRGIVSGVEEETLTTLIYDAKSSDGIGYFISPTGHTGYWLPHRIHRIDHDQGVIYCRSTHSLAAIPAELVFSPDPDKLGTWQFDRARTTERNGY